jgi:hypothetical protein
MIELGRDREAAEQAVRDAAGATPPGEDALPDPEQPEAVDTASDDAPAAGPP